MALASHSDFQLGTWSVFASANHIEIFSKHLDFIIFDFEHGDYSLKLLADAIRACEVNNCKAWVRIPSFQSDRLQNILDLGAHTIVIPQLKNISMVKEAVSKIYYPPVGIRGYNPFTRANLVSSKVMPSDISTCIILETVEAYKDIDAILELPKVDIIYIGIYDLSASLGKIGQLNDPELVSIVESSIKKIKGKEKKVALMVKNQEDYSYYKKLGADIFVYATDSYILDQELSRISKLIRD